MATAELARVRSEVKHMLIATDLSHRSDAALDYALEFARIFGAQADIAYVLPTDEYALAGCDGLGAGRDAARRDLLDLRSRLRKQAAYNDDSEYKVTLLEGPVAESLLHTALEKRVDLLVVGTHGRGGLGKAFLGSVAEQVFRHSAAPVLTVGPGVRAHAHKVQVRRILAPCDLSPRAHEAVHYACSLARWHGAQVTVMNVVESWENAAKADPERVRHDIREKLRNIVGAEAEGLNIQYQATFGKVGGSILEVASQLHADLIVLGVRRSSGPLDRFMWPVAYELVCGASCPVLTIRGA
jgi:nucleotide-binding universal stress UspA family protein